MALLIKIIDLPWGGKHHVKNSQNLDLEKMLTPGKLASSTIRQILVCPYVKNIQVYFVLPVLVDSVALFEITLIYPQTCTVICSVYSTTASQIFITVTCKI